MRARSSSQYKGYVVTLKLGKLWEHCEIEVVCKGSIDKQSDEGTVRHGRGVRTSLRSWEKRATLRKYT